MSRQIGYFCYQNLHERHFGAVLVTNQIAVPVEFKYTEPIRCSSLHKILYGESLQRYLRQTLIRERLAEALESNAEFFIASYEERDFLSTIGGRAMIAVESIGVGSTSPTSEVFTRVKDRQAIVTLEEGPQLRLAFSTADNTLQRHIVSWLQELSRTMDLLEPMERVQHALKVLSAEQDSEETELFEKV